MDQLILVVNRLQNAFATVGVSNPIDLPQITVIGSQSSGKSSVLENIVGRDFLPRGSGIVTRRPLVLQLINRPVDKKNGDEPDEWGEFLHRPGERFSDFKKIRDEIVKDTDAKTGGKLAISALPINLRVYSPNVLTLTLVDLPGLTKVPVGDQPPDIERQIRDMIMKFITKPNAIILAVTAANTDLANSDGLKLAREVDPEGSRTIGVLTKVDLMDAGTDVVDILAGRVIPLRLGYVPVVNRSQRDIDTSKTISSALDYEKRFFENHAAYSSKAQFCGTPFLARKLNLILMHHIRTTLPDIKNKITSHLVKVKAELAQLGDENSDSQAQMANNILAIITEFTAEFRTIIDGSSSDLSSQELSGGARISFVFHEVFKNGIEGVDPFDQIKDVDIRTILYNSSGSAPSLFVGTQAFEVLVKQQIKRLEEPALKCVSLVYEELVRILMQLEGKSHFKRFPNLKDRFHGCCVNFLRKCLNPTNKMVSDVIAAEANYINTGHPDFLTGHRAMAIVSERLQAQKAGSASNPAPGDKSKGSQNYTPAPEATPQSDNSFFSSFFKGDKKKKGLEPPPPVLKASGTLSERENVETEVIKLLLQSYFRIVKRTVADLIPKAIMLHLVTSAKEELQRELLAELYKTEILEDLLKESEAVVARRSECKKMIEALSKADEIVSSV